MQTIFILEDDPARQAAFKVIFEGHRVIMNTTVLDAEAAWEDLTEAPRMMLLDHDLGFDEARKNPKTGLYEPVDVLTGEDFVKWLLSNKTSPRPPRDLQTVIHSWNTAGASRMLDLFIRHNHSAIMRWPFDYHMLKFVRDQARQTVPGGHLK